MLATQLALLPVVEEPDDPRALMHYIYFIEAADMGRIKIGRATNLENRLGQIATDSPCPVALIDAIAVPFDVVGRVESTIHGDFVQYRVNKNREWFEINKKIVKKYIAVNGLRDLTTMLEFMIWTRERDIVWLQYLDQPINDYDVVYTWHS